MADEPTVPERGRRLAQQLAGQECLRHDLGQEWAPCRCVMLTGQGVIEIRGNPAPRIGQPGGGTMRAFIIFRDRVSYAKRCLEAIMEADLNPVIVDQGSTWPPALEWLGWLESRGVTVLRHGGGHPREIWDWGPFRALCGDDWYLVTDCDVVPSEDCPADWPARLVQVLDGCPGFRKIGLGLRLDRIPEHYRWRENVIRWEANYWQNELSDGVYAANTDTTLAVYRPSGGGFGGIDGSLRTGHPYVADHLPWYEDLGSLDEELRWYHEHAEPGVTFWAPGQPQA